MAKYITFGLLAIVMLFPLYWMFIGSFEDARGIYHMPPSFVPKGLTLENYRVIFSRIHPVYQNSLVRAIANTIEIGVISIVLHLFVCFSAGYAFAVYNFRGKAALFWLLMMTFALNRYQMLIPQYLLMSKLHLINTAIGAAFPYIFAPFAIFFFRNYLLAIPKSLIDSARMDGAGEWRILWRVLVPLCGPVVGVLALFKGIEVSGDYLWPLLVLPWTEHRTYAVEIITRIRSADYTIAALTPIGRDLAGGVVLVAFPLLLFILTSRKMIDGLNTGGIKE